MKLRRLELRGIGPFATRFSIDFDRLGVAGIFLLEGPTGSGKSTIIDAITWALYGSVAGGEDSTSDRMRSTHADPRKESYVDLVFTVGAGTYRVRRTPSWTRAGNKNPSNVTAKLWKLYEGAIESGDVDAGVLLENKAAGTGVAVTELIGLTRKQFVQTIVLPQGKFAEFLRLNSTERTGLLEQIFGTEVYRRLAERLSAMASGASDTVQSSRRSFVTALENLLEGSDALDGQRDAVRAAGEDLDDPEASGSLIRMMESVQREAVAAHKAAVVARNSATTELERAEAKLRQERDLASRVATRRTLLERRRQLEEQEPEVRELKTKLEVGRKASRLLFPVEKAEEAASAAALARKTLSQVCDLPPDTVNADSLAGLENEVRELNALSGSLLELERMESKLVVARREQRSDEAQYKAIHSEWERASAKALPMPERIAELRANREEAAASFAGLSGAKAALSDAEQRVHKVKELESLRGSMERAETSVGSHLSQFRTLKARHNALTEAWIASTAANLALELEDHHPCPVCGSVEHPSPAPATDRLATIEEVRSAEKSRRAAEAALQESRTALESLRATATTMEADLAGLTTAMAAQQLEEARDAIAAAEQAGISATELAQSIASLERKHSELLSRITELREKSTTLETRLSERNQRIEVDDALLSEALGDFESVGERRRAHDETVAAHTRELAALRTWLQAVEATATANAELSQALEPSDFASGTEVRAALVAPTEASLWEERVATHHQNLHDVLRDLSSPQISALNGSEEARVDEAQTARDLAAAQAESSTSAAFAAEFLANQMEGRVSRVRSQLDVWAAAKKSAGPIVRLAGLANASPDVSFTRMTLPTYVLSQRFKLVVEQANQHLAVFSLGRYELVSTEEKEKGSRAHKVGLGLEIIDHIGDSMGDVRRATKSLSGGETFYVSLALALALADVVCSENGGIRLDTLMIDEGFGTLDDNTRDQVMEVLTSLATNGRMVGVVSHVEELKKMIAEQIVVRQLSDGSSNLEVRA